ncbi:unnamed protein product [Scytosiphon promiscuus]
MRDLAGLQLSAPPPPRPPVPPCLQPSFPIPAAIRSGLSSGIGGSSAGGSSAGGSGGGRPSVVPPALTQVGRSDGSMPPRQQWKGAFNLRIAEERFKCMYKGGCMAGKDFDLNVNRRGSFHDAGTERVAFLNPNRENYSAFCPAHVDAVRPQHDEAIRVWNNKKSVTPAENKGKARVKRAGGSGSGTAAGVPPQVKRGRVREASAASIAEQKALLKMSFPKQTDLQDDDDDLSSTLEQRQQRHGVMEAATVNDMVKKVVMKYVEGMPRAESSGGITRSKAPWNSVPSNSFPLVDMGCPIQRAQRLLPAVGCPVAASTKQEILEQFHVSGTVAIFAPEVLCRRELSRDPHFRKTYVGEAGEVVGVTLPCPNCRSNKHITSSAWNPDLRAVHTSKGKNILVVSRRYRCFNPGCSEVMKLVKKAMPGPRGHPDALPRSGPDKRLLTSGERAKMRAGDLSDIAPNVIYTFLKGGWSFPINNKRYMEILPPAARMRFPFNLYGKGGACHALLDQTMIPGQSVAAMAREVAQLYAHEQTQNMLKYAAFTKSEGGVWPAWEAVGEGTWLSPPTVSNMETYAEARYQEVKPFLHREMCSRSCQVLAWDGTFASATQVTSAAKVLVSLLNETGHVLAYAAVPSESWAHVLPMFMGLRDRLEAMGKLDELTTTSSDTCCEGANDLTKHPTLVLFRGLTRPPMSDPFHKGKIVTSSMFSGNEFYAGACREMGAIVAKPCERDQFRCASSLVDSGFSAQEAIDKALGGWGKRYIRTSTPRTIDADLEAWGVKYNKVNEELLARGKTPLFRERRGVQAGTNEALLNVRKCARKGCFFSGLKLKDEYWTSTRWIALDRRRGCTWFTAGRARPSVRASTACSNGGWCHKQAVSVRSGLTGSSPTCSSFTTTPWTKGGVSGSLTSCGGEAGVSLLRRSFGRTSMGRTPEGTSKCLLRNQPRLLPPKRDCGTMGTRFLGMNTSPRTTTENCRSVLDWLALNWSGSKSTPSL